MKSLVPASCQMINIERLFMWKRFLYEREKSADETAVNIFSERRTPPKLYAVLSVNPVPKIATFISYVVEVTARSI